MRLMKVLAIAVGILIVFFVISFLWHILYLIGVGLVIVAALFAAYKGWEQYKLARQRHEQRRDQRQRERQQQRDQRRSGSRAVEPARERPSGLPPAARSDVDEELARLKRETFGS